MDELGKLLLEVLQAHGMQKSEALAVSLGVGGRTIRRRLSEMKRDGVFKLVPIPNRVSLGHRAWARIGIKISLKSSFEVAKSLVDHPLICSVASSIGSFDFIIDVQIDTFEELAHFINAELTRIQGIQNTETMILMTPRKYYEYFWPEPKYHEKCKYCNNTIIKKSKIDDIDRKIIDILTHEGLLPLPVLESKLKISNGTIRKRVKDLLKHQAFKIEVVPDPSVSGYEIAATVGVMVNDCSAHAVIDKIIDNPSVYLASTSLSRFNVVLGVRYQNMELFTKFINKDLTSIPGVNYIEPFLHTKLLKFHTIKWPANYSP
jgi:DNA-binding Lrp family transcriptional regulator